MLWQQQHDGNRNQSFRYKVFSIQIRYKLKQWNCTTIALTSSIVCVKWRMILVVVNKIYATACEAWKKSGLQLDLNPWYTTAHLLKPRWSAEFFSGFFTQLHKLRSLWQSFLHFHFISTVHIWFISYINNTEATYVGTKSIMCSYVPVKEMNVTNV